MRIYTKTGDDGQTGLVGGQRISKTSLRIEAIGDIDELNALVGICRVADTQTAFPLLEKIQNWLFDLGSEVACPKESKFEIVSVGDVHSQILEASIDEAWTSLPPLKNFILPGGTSLAASLHHCRSVCRRAERHVLALHQQEPQRQELLMFLNRLSDWFFAVSRKANQLRNVEDVIWKKEQL